MPTKIILGWTKPIFRHDDHVLIFDRMRPYIVGIKLGSESRNVLDHGHIIEMCYERRLIAFLDYKPAETVGALKAVLKNMPLYLATMATIDGNVSSAAMNEMVSRCHDAGCKAIAVTVKSDMSRIDCRRIYCCDPLEACRRLALRARELGCDGAVVPGPFFPELKRNGVLDASFFGISAGARWHGEPAGGHEYPFTPEFAAQAQIDCVVADTAIFHSPSYDPIAAARRMHRIFNS